MPKSNATLRFGCGNSVRRRIIGNADGREADSLPDPRVPGRQGLRPAWHYDDGNGCPETPGRVSERRPSNAAGASLLGTTLARRIAGRQDGECPPDGKPRQLTIGRRSHIVRLHEVIRDGRV